MQESQVRDIIEKIVDQVLSGEQSKATKAVKTYKVALGGDHGGFEMKQFLVAKLKELGHNITDCGTNSKDAVDYPDIALAVAKQVASGQVHYGIMIDGAGIGSAMCANKVKGIRAAMAYSDKTILNSKLHNHANVLTLGALYHTNDEAYALAKLWLETEFEGGRHQKRIDKMMDIER